MQRMWRQLFAALVAVVAVAGVASAQAPIPQPLPDGAARVQAIVSPAQVAGTPLSPVGGQTYVQGSGCCTSAPAGCGRSSHGCGSVKSDCNHVFGSCRSFFSPCGPGSGGHGRHGDGCGIGGHGGLGGRHGQCGFWDFGKGYAHSWTHCVYDSFLNH
jgi:hypothetical protein